MVGRLLVTEVESEEVCKDIRREKILSEK